MKRFPRVSGPFGLAGAVLFVAALICELVAVFAVMDAAFNSDLRRAAPWFVLFVVSLPLFAAGAYLLRLGSKRAGTLPSNPMPNYRRTALLRAGSVIVLGSVFGFGGFLYLAFALKGNRRLAFALAALIAGTAISEVGTKMMFTVLGRPVPSLFLGSSRRSSVLFVAVLLVEATLVLIGLLPPDLIPTP